MRFIGRLALLVLAAGVAASCARKPASSPRDRPAPDLEAAGRLPTGARLDPEGTLVAVGNFPLALQLSPDRRYALLLLSGWREQGLQVVDRAAGRVPQDLPLPAAFLGLAFAPDGRVFYASGGNGDVVYAFDWAYGRATLRDSLLLEPDTAAAPSSVAPGAVRQVRTDGSHYPAGLAVARDGATLYVAENLGDDVAVIDLTSRTTPPSDSACRWWWRASTSASRPCPSCPARKSPGS